MINEVTGLYLVKVISEYFAYNNLAIVYKDMHWKLAGIK